jgi:nicotinic acid mononucleotide adenylyltransferase/predicted nucleotidyltransferase|tara:strand:+ start:1979 stop:4330 length:2352 start_codon:yes stop_codon:yes gene_type:complete
MDSKRTRSEKKNMKTFKDYLIKESIIDIPRRTYAPGVFDNADSKDPKIKPSVKELINKQIEVFEKEYPVIKIALIGSILTKRYRNDADLDINILFDVPKDKQEDERVNLSQKYLSAKNPKNIQGKLIPGTKHPINYYFITDQKTYDDQNKKADAVFDIEKDKFIKRPDDFTFDTNLYIKEFERKVQELDVVKGELKRDIIDYHELVELQPDDILNLQEKINEKLEEIEDSIKEIIKIGDNVDADRRAAFAGDMTPDEIRKYGVKNRLPKNVIYKMLEKYHYLKFYKKCKQILDDGKVTDDEIKSLTAEQIDNMNLESIASAWDDLIRRTIRRKEMGRGLQLYIKYLKQGMKDAKNKAAQHAGIDYGVFGKAVRDAGLPEEVNEDLRRPRKTIAFTFGRFNPPTIGHEKLIRKVKSVRANDHKIYLSRSEDSKKNPLSPQQKLAYMKKMFPSHARNIEINRTNMILDIATNLHNKGYTEIFMVVGSDRVREFETILNKYNDVRSRHGYYNFDNINVLSAGERDPDAEGATGMSASKMRAAASANDLQAFKRGLPTGVNASDLMKDVRKGMRIAASIEYNFDRTSDTRMLTMEEFDQQQIRDLYLRDMIFNIGEKVDYTKQDIQGTVKRKGTNYIVLEDNNNNLHKAWIWDCIPIASDKEVAVREHNLNIDYGFKAISEKKFADLKKELTMKLEKEAFEIGHDYANHTKDITPGEKPEAKPVDVKERGWPTVGYKEIKDDKISEKDVNNWATEAETIDKYKQRFKEEWKSKLSEAVEKMLKDLQS